MVSNYRKSDYVLCSRLCVLKESHWKISFFFPQEKVLAIYFLYFTSNKNVSEISKVNNNLPKRESLKRIKISYPKVKTYLNTNCRSFSVHYNVWAVQKADICIC